MSSLETSSLETLCQQFLSYLEAKFSFKLNIKPDAISHALVHPSYAHEKSLLTSYEKLEFLGDSIVNAIVTTSLFERFSEESEGTLSRLRAALVSTDSLSHLAQAINLEQYLCVTGLKVQEYKKNNSKTLGRAFEALIGALFLELGFDQCRNLLLKVFDCWEELNQQSWFDKERLLSVDVKSILQEKLHARGLHNPQYIMIEHHKKNTKDEFIMALMIDQKEIARAEGNSKKEAEKLVAKKILDNWLLIEEMR
jgi:ribonuclease-3